MGKVRIGVKERMTGKIVYKSRYTDYYTDNKRAETWCRENLCERGTILDIDYFRK